MREGETQLLFRNLSAQNFQRAYKFSYEILKFVSDEEKRKLISKIRDFAEGVITREASGATDKEISEFLDFVANSGVNRKEAAEILFQMIDNNNQVTELKSRLDKLRLGIPKLRANLEFFERNTPESVIREIEMQRLEARKRQEEEKDKAARNIYKEKWLQGNLIPDIRQLNGTEKRLVNETIEMIINVYHKGNVLYCSQEITRLVKSNWEDYPHVFMIPQNFGKLIGYFWYLIDEKTLTEDHRKNLSVGWRVDISQIYAVVQKYALNQDNALFVTSFFKSLKFRGIVGEFDEICHEALRTLDIDDVTRLRIERLVTPFLKKDIGSLTNDQLLKVASDSDVFDTVEVVKELLIRNEVSDNFIDRLGKSWKEPHLESIINQAKVRLGDKIILKKVLQERNKVGISKKTQPMSPLEIAELVRECFQADHNEDFVRIAYAELENYQEPSLITEIIQDQNLPIEERQRACLSLDQSGFVSELCDTLDKTPELLVGDIRISYIQSVQDMQRSPSGLRQSIPESELEFRQVVNLFIKNGETREVLDYAGANQTLFANILTDGEIVSALENSSDELIYELSKVFSIAQPKLFFKVARHAKFLSKEDLEDKVGQLRASFVETNENEIAEIVVSLQVSLDEEPESLLESVITGSNSSIAGKAAAELGLRRYIAEDQEAARDYAEPYANSNIECAHLMYKIEPGNLEWLHNISDLIEADSREIIRNRWEKIPGQRLMPADELEDPDYHIDLIKKLIKKREVKERKNKNWVEETWFCRKEAFSREHRCETHQDENRGHLGTARLNYGEENNFVDFPFSSDGRFLKGVIGEKKLHSWQEEAINSWVAHGRQGIIEAVTGSGKSKVGALAIAEAIEEDYAVLLLVPTRVLADQWIKDNLGVFWRSGKLNRIGNTTTELDVEESYKALPGMLTVAVKSATVNESVNQWIDRAPKGTKFMLVADEVHHLSGGSYQELLKEEFERRMGLTATLLRNEYSQTRLKNYFSGEPVYSYSFKQAKMDQVITNYDVIMLGVRMSETYNELYRATEYEWRKSRDHLLRMTGKIDKIPASEIFEFAKSLVAHERHGEYASQFVEIHRSLDRLINNSAMESATAAISLIAPLITRYGKTALFADFKDKAENVKQVLTHRGVNTEIMSGDTPFYDREKLFKDLDAGDGRLHAIAAPRVLDEGVDIQQLTIGCFVGRIRDRRMLIQRLGRVLRRHPQKVKAFAVIVYVIGTNDDPDLPGNRRLEFSEFDFIGENAEQLTHFQVGRNDSAIQELLSTI